MEFSAIIVDDERLARVSLKKLLVPFTNINIVGEADSCTSAIEQIEIQKPQLVFLDIQLIGETGFDIVDKIDPAIKVVFVTAYDQYAIRAFEINALDYLLKPVNPKRLAATIERLARNTPSGIASTKRFKYTDSVYVKLNINTSTFIKIDSIRFIGSIGNYSKLTLTKGNKALVLKTLKQWMEELPNEKFVRIHQSTIVNLDYIDCIEKYDSNHHRIILKGNEEPLEISRRFMKSLKTKFNV